jgi:hypothetical protein
VLDEMNSVVFDPLTLTLSLGERGKEGEIFIAIADWQATISK